MEWGIGLALVLLGLGIMLLAMISRVMGRRLERCAKIDCHMLGFHVLASGTMYSSVLWWIEGSQEMSVLARAYETWCLVWAVLSLLTGVAIGRGLLPTPCSYSDWPFPYRLFLLVGVVSILITTGLSL